MQRIYVYIVQRIRGLQDSQDSSVYVCTSARAINASRVCACGVQTPIGAHHHSYFRGCKCYTARHETGSTIAGLFFGSDIFRVATMPIFSASFFSFLKKFVDVDEALESLFQLRSGGNLATFQARCNDNSRMKIRSY